MTLTSWEHITNWWKCKMVKANQLANALLDDVFKSDLKEEFISFKLLAQDFDAFNIDD